MKNLCNKIRDKSDPYEVWVHQDWTWRVLRKYQASHTERANPDARWFCFVTSDLCPDGEYGDVYVADIMRYGTKQL